MSLQLFSQTLEGVVQKQYPGLTVLENQPNFPSEGTHPIQGISSRFDALQLFSGILSPGLGVSCLNIKKYVLIYNRQFDGK